MFRPPTQCGVPAPVFPVPSLTEALCSKGPAPDRAQAMGEYGWLVGRWHLDVEIYPPGEPPYRTDGFASAEWVLEGRAIQDVFAVPGLFYGSTMRVYDPALGAWHVLWADPLHQVYASLVGRRYDGEIVNEGEEPPQLGRLYGEPSGGAPATIRWTFGDVTASSFIWRSERSLDGITWQLQRKYLARRQE